MYRIQLDPGTWQQFVKRADNVGLPLTEVSKKYMTESTLYANQLFEAIRQQQIQSKMDVYDGAALPRAVTPSVTPSVSVTPSITPSVSVTPSLTPSISVTPSVTPSTSFFT